jgi:hypothetical protein
MFGFRRWLHRHGYLTPHFRLSEAACKDGTPVPKALIHGARDHAFALERLRHRLGDRPIQIISWYRHPAYNRRIRGASRSQHLTGKATDHPQAWVEDAGRAQVQAAANAVFAKGGVGIYPGGSMHFDSRGFFARWSSF